MRFIHVIARSHPVEDISKHHRLFRVTFEINVCGMVPVTECPEHLFPDFEDVYVEPEGEIFDRFRTGQKILSGFFTVHRLSRPNANCVADLESRVHADNLVQLLPLRHLSLAQAVVLETNRGRSVYPSQIGGGGGNRTRVRQHSVISSTCLVTFIDLTH